MTPICRLSPNELEARINRYTPQAKDQGNPDARRTLQTLLLEKARRCILAFTDQQLDAAVLRYRGKVRAAEQGADKVLARLLAEQTRRRGVLKALGLVTPPSADGGAFGHGQHAVSVTVAHDGRPSDISRRSTGATPVAPQGTAHETASQRCSSAGSTSKYRGVKGWLLLFCVSLTILNPLFATAAFAVGVIELIPHFNRFPALAGIVVVDGLLSAGVVAWGMYAGIALWTVQRNAVLIAKSYLVAFLITSAVSKLVLPLMAGLPPEACTAVLFEGCRGMAWSGIGFSIWHRYLKTSKRVKATFPAQ